MLYFYTEPVSGPDGRSQSCLGKLQSEAVAAQTAHFAPETRC